MKWAVGPWGVVGGFGSAAGWKTALQIAFALWLLFGAGAGGGAAGAFSSAGVSEGTEEEDDGGEGDDCQCGWGLPVHGLGVAEEFAALVDEEGGEVGEEGHAEELAEGPFPGAGFTTYDDGRREALKGVDEEDDDGESNEGGVEKGAVVAGGGGELATEAFFVFFVGGVGDGEGGAEDFTRGEGGHHGGAHAVVPAEGADDGFEDLADFSVEGVFLLDGGVFGIALGVGVEEPEEDGEAEDDGAGFFDEGEGAFPDLVEDVTPLWFLVRGEFEEELGGFGFTEAGFEDFGGDEGGEGAEGVDAEEGEALVEGSGEDEGDD